MRGWRPVNGVVARVEDNGDYWFRKVPPKGHLLRESRGEITGSGKLWGRGRERRHRGNRRRSRGSIRKSW